jgi:hypothetical protein
MNTNITNPSVEQIEAWKKEHKQIFEIEVEGRKCWLRKPNREIMRFMLSTGNDPLSRAEALLRDCWLGGDMEIQTDDDLFMAAAGVIEQILPVANAEVKKISITP